MHFIVAELCTGSQRSRPFHLSCLHESLSLSKSNTELNQHILGTSFFWYNRTRRTRVSCYEDQRELVSELMIVYFVTQTYQFIVILLQHASIIFYSVTVITCQTCYLFTLQRIIQVLKAGTYVKLSIDIWFTK